MKYTTLTLKKFVVITCVGFGFLTACGEKKETATTAEKVEMEAKTKEAAKKENDKKVEALKKLEAEREEMEKRKADSIRQVREHGHAH